MHISNALTPLRYSATGVHSPAREIMRERARAGAGARARAGRLMPVQRSMEARERHTVATAAKGCAAAPAGDLDLPYGRSIFPAVAEAGGGTLTGGAVSVLFTLLALLALPWLPTTLAALSNSSWDDEHGVSFSGDLLDMVGTLLREATGRTDIQLKNALSLTLGACGLLMIADIASEFFPNVIHWPVSWNCDNQQCYREMFCEPTREGCLVRRAGNCYSNASYLFTSLVVSLSAWQQHKQGVWNSMAFADAMFGVMLLALAVSSVIWHASNAPKSQYIDLWSMDSCILYLILRIACLGMKSTCTYLGASDRACAQTASITCAMMYGLLLARNAAHQWKSHKTGYLDGGCPFSMRNRVLGRGGSRGSLIKKPPSIRGVCIFLGMPIVYMVVPSIVMLATRAPGSVIAGQLMLVSLVIGWSWRMMERWALDGCGPMNSVHALQRRWLPQRRLIRGVRNRAISVVLTTLAAAVSPTAVLHLFTGATLLLGYVVVRSMDSVLM